MIKVGRGSLAGSVEKPHKDLAFCCHFIITTFVSIETLHFFLLLFPFVSCLLVMRNMTLGNMNMNEHLLSACLTAYLGLM